MSPPTDLGDLGIILNILEFIGTIWEYTKDMKNNTKIHDIPDYEKYDSGYFSDSDKNSLLFASYNNGLNYNASLNLLQCISENVKVLSDEIKDENIQINWHYLLNLRNQTIYNNIGTNTVKTLKIIDKDLKYFYDQFINLIRNNIQYYESLV